MIIWISYFKTKKINKGGEKRLHWNNWDENTIKMPKQMDTDMDTDSYDSDSYNSDDSCKKI